VAHDRNTRAAADKLLSSPGQPSHNSDARAEADATLVADALSAAELENAGPESDPDEIIEQLLLSLSQLIGPERKPPPD
jgi:hypothetical protein